MTEEKTIEYLEKWGLSCYFGEAGFFLSTNVNQVINEWIDNFGTHKKNIGISILEKENSANLTQSVTYDICKRLMTMDKIKDFILVINLSELLQRFGSSFDEINEKMVEARGKLFSSSLVILMNLGVSKYDNSQLSMLNILLNDIIKLRKSYLATLCCTESQIEDYMGHANLKLLQFSSHWVRV